MKTQLVLPVLFTSSFLAAQGEVKVPRSPITQAPAKTSSEMPAPQPASLEVQGGSALPVRSKGLTGHLPAPEARRIGRCYDQDASGTLLVATDDWKASFDQDGATFVPFFGSSAPANFPASFGLRDVTVAGVQLPQGKVQPTRNGDVVSFQRQGLVEAYEVRAEGLEQTFTFATLPSRGEIAVTMGVQTSLEVAQQGREFRFANQLGSFRYGAALAIDATGTRLDLVTEYRDGALTITVPQSFVAEAVLPLVIDPMIGSVTMLGTQQRSILSADIAYVSTADEYVAVWEYVFSQTDSDSYVQRFDGLMAAVGSYISVDSSSTLSWRKCRIAANDLNYRYLVVAEVNSVATPMPWISGRMLIGGSPPAFQPQFDIEKAGIASHFGNASNPDVGGDSSLAPPTYFTVVWEYAYGPADHDIYMKQVKTDGTLRAAAPTVLDSSTNDEHNPVISKTDGQEPINTQAWAVAWRRDYLASTNGQMRACLLEWDGAIVQVGGIDTFALTGTTPNDEGSWSVSSPQDDARGRRFAMVQVRRNTQSNLTEIHATCFNRSGAIVVPSTRILSSPSVGYNLRSPDVDCDGFRFAVGFNEVWNPAPLDLDVWFATFGVTGNQFFRHDVIDAVRSSDVESAPSLVARRGNGSGQVHGAVWCRELSSSTGRIEAQNYEGLGAGGWALRSTGCGGLSMTVQGNPKLGETMTFSLNGNGLKGYVVGAPVSVPVAVCPSCTQGVNGNSVIVAQLGVAIPWNAALVGSTFAFQGFEFTINGTCLGQLKLSNTADVTVK